MKTTDLIKDGDKFTDKDGNTILRIIDGKMYEYVDGNYILYEKYGVKKLEYTDESTFITEEVKFSDEHYELAKNLRGSSLNFLVYKQYENELWSKCTPIMAREDKQSLVFCVNLGDKSRDRVAYERGDNKYRIIIERINEKS